MSQKKKKKKKKRKRKRKRKRKEKEKEKEFVKAAALGPETRARSEGYMAKAFKAWCLEPTGQEPPI